MSQTESTLYAGRDPRDLPIYSIADAAIYLGIPASTLRAWTGAKTYRAAGELRKMKPLVVPDLATGLLTFHNFVEAYVLASLTRRFALPLSRVRAALHFIGGERPLLTTELKTDRVGIYVERVESLIDASRGGQAAIREVVEGSLERVDFDAQHRPERVYPWRRDIHEPKLISLDPRRAFGRPTLAGRGIKIDVIIDRVRAGDSVEFLANQYGVDREAIEGVVRWGLDAAQAA